MQSNTKSITNYLIGFLLVPWIWVWGAYIVILVLLSFYVSLDNFHEINLGVMQTLSQDISLGTMTLAFGFMILLNYSLGYWLEKTYPKINNLLFGSSCLLLFFLFLYSWGHYREVLLGA
ncbi:MAG: hypothetical protein AAGF07_01380 [Patescibacteria group bacterium]